MIFLRRGSHVHMWKKHKGLGAIRWGCPPLPLLPSLPLPSHYRRGAVLPPSWGQNLVFSFGAQSFLSFCRALLLLSLLFSDPFLKLIISIYMLNMSPWQIDFLLPHINNNNKKIMPMEEAVKEKKKKQITFGQCLLGARHCSWDFTCVISFNLHKALRDKYY